jgi:hypothetical protein
MASSSSDVGRRKSHRFGSKFSSVHALLANVFGKCWVTAPVAKSRRLPGEPSPDQPVAPFCVDVLSANVCGTPRITPGLANPSTFSRIVPSRRNRRISRSASSGVDLMTNSGSFLGSARTNAGSSVKLLVAGWQVPQVRPLPSKVSLRTAVYHARSVHDFARTQAGKRGG